MSEEKKILIVDDDPDLVKLMKDRFEFHNYQVITASDGDEGLERARVEQPDLILLDLMLPRRDGYKVCRLLKFDKKFQHIPIIMLTARAQERDKELGAKTGADAYITKPFDPNDLVYKVRELLGEKC